MKGVQSKRNDYLTVESEVLEWEIILDRMQIPLRGVLSCLSMHKAGSSSTPAPFHLGSVLGWCLPFQKSMSVDGRGWTGRYGWFEHCVASFITGNTCSTMKRRPSHSFLIRTREYADNLLGLL